MRLPECDRQWAIQLPDGSLHSTEEYKPSASMFDLPYLFGGRASMPEDPPKRKVVVFDTREAADKALHNLAKSAKAYGITNLGATVVSRMVGPWRTDLQVRNFVQDVEAFLAEGGDA